ncbi:MAG: [Fe-S]-binding protein [Pirellulales bacterium]|nr:[Fe-S]-binding protein [Pirellulales bacterium]
MAFPRFFLVQQSFPRPGLGDGAADPAGAIRTAVAEELTKCGFASRIRPGETVAITAGSRGIANIALILRAAVDFIRGCGGEPFLVPAMGSHGGGTADGQVEVLTRLGVTEQTVGCPIRSSMATRVLGELSPKQVWEERELCEDDKENGVGAVDLPTRRCGLPLHFDEHASSADHTLVINRIKPHTHFVGDIQSGLVKMLLIGLGKHEGAKLAHRAAIDYGWQRIAHAGAKLAIANSNCAAGLAIIENGFDETAELIGLSPEDFLTSERELLQQAESLMAKLPFASADVLIVDETGKNISGAGMDTTIVGRKPGLVQSNIKRIWARRLSEETRGNATGLGAADYCSPGLIKQIDHHVTRINCTTGGNPRAGLVPLSFETERKTATAVFSTLGLCPPQDAGVIWIRNTRHLEHVACSEFFLDAAKAREDLTITSGLFNLSFDDGGEMMEMPCVDDFLG